MNPNNLNQIFSHYIENFDRINNTNHRETYKWQVAKDFRPLMDQALAADDESFVAALKRVKAATYNMIDNYTQPLHGMIDIAKREPASVRQVFRDLYADDGNDLQIRQEKIADFFGAATELQERYFPGSHLYKQDFHAVSGYLFLHDPDNHYHYKATQAWAFADCVEFLDDWGYGQNVKLNVYYRMCDQLVEAMLACEPLMAIDASRFEGRCGCSADILFPDTKKHVLAFDLIYCCSVYGLFKGITYTKLNAKDKQVYKQKQKEAEQLLQDQEVACNDYEKLQEAVEYFVDALKPGTTVRHKKFGTGKVSEIDKDYIYIRFTDSDETKKLGWPSMVVNRILTTDSEGFEEARGQHADVLRRKESICKAVDRLERMLQDYEKYIS